MLFEKVRNMGGRTTPTVMRVAPQEEEKKGRETVIEMTDIIWDAPIDRSIFSRRNLKNTR